MRKGPPSGHGRPADGASARAPCLGLVYCKISIYSDLRILRKQSAKLRGLEDRELRRHNLAVSESLGHRVKGMFPDARPIFVVGAARSGTSIVCDALRFGAQIPGTREGFLYSNAYLLLTYLDQAWSQIGPGLSDFAAKDRGDPVRERAIARFDFRALQADLLRHFHQLSSQGEQVWLDKTPDIYMVHVSPILAAMYPQARWVWVQRNGVEVLDSRRRTHPEMTFAEGCDDWASVVRDWYRASGAFEGRWITVDQREVAVSGPKVAARLASFLVLDDAQQRGIAKTFATHQPGKTMGRRFDEVLTLDRADWPEEQKQTFRARCREAMALAGYDGEGDPLQPRA